MDSNLGILLIHGFTGSNLELSYIGNELARIGARVAIPLLPGHGTHYEDLRETNQLDWYKKAELALEFLQNENQNRAIVVIGHSMGGTLALRIGENHPEINAVISLAGPVRFNQLFRFTIKLISNINLNIKYDEFRFTDERLLDHPALQYFAKNYNKVPLKSVGNLFDLMEDVFQNLHTIEMPVSLIYAEDDYIIPKNQVKRILEKIQSNTVLTHWLKKSNHIVVIDIERDIVVEKIIEFIRNLNLIF